MSENVGISDPSSIVLSKNQSHSQSGKMSKRHHSSKKHQKKKKHIISSSESESESDSEDSASTHISSDTSKCLSSSESSNRSKKRSKNQNLKRRKYLCRKCKAHGKEASVKMHKRRCPYKECQCTSCSLVTYGRFVVAKQIALFRFGIFQLIPKYYLFFYLV